MGNGLGRGWIWADKGWDFAVGLRAWGWGGERLNPGCGVLDKTFER